MPARIVLAILALSAFYIEGEPDIRALLVAPGNTETGSDVVHSRNRTDPAVYLAIKLTALVPEFFRDITGKFIGEYMGGIEGRAGLFQILECFHERTRSGQQEERSRDLKDSEKRSRLLLPCDAGSAAGQAKPLLKCPWREAGG